jgi:CubicO group peptidase (beta-lactamase class C family)
MLYKLILLTLFLFASKTQMAQSKSSEIDKIMKRYNAIGQFNGLVLVAEKGKIIYEKAFGKASYEWQIDNALDTKMEIASITKTFTALLIMKLIEQGKIKLNGTIADYIVGYKGEGASQITVDHLLRHSSGLQQDIGDFPTNSNDFPDIVAKINEDFFSLEEQVEIIAKRALLFAPGTKYSYSSDGYAVLGLIIERVTGLSYEEALQQLILKPLHLSNTGYKNHLAMIPEKAQGYVKSYEGISRGRHIGINPAGGMYSTLHDLFLWEQALDKDQLISQQSKDIIFTKTPYLVGYGWQISNNYFNSTTDSIKMVRCTGSLPGFSSLVVRFPQYGKTIIVMENLKQPVYRQFDIINKVASILFKKPYEFPKPSLAESMLATLQKDGIQRAIKQYEGNKKTGESAVNESEINSAGYYLLNTQKQVDEAIAFFKMNVELFPKSANAYDSLGEGYMRKGDKQKARFYYEESLRLDPGNDNAKRILDNLK